MGKINAVKTTIDGYEFDSLTEGEFYKHLRSRDDVSIIEIHPHVKLLDSFRVVCGRCNQGKIKSNKTGKQIQCERCKGKGYITRQPWTYTPDFKVIWKEGFVSWFDVKGGFKDAKFNYVKKMFERESGIELLVVKEVKGKWKYM